MKKMKKKSGMLGNAPGAAKSKDEMSSKQMKKHMPLKKGMRGTDS